MGGNADAPAEQHPDEPEIAGVAVEIERGEQADHQHIDAEMDEKSARGVISGHDLHSLTSVCEPQITITHDGAARFTACRRHAG